jgi:hypothetical protein
MAERVVIDAALTPALGEHDRHGDGAVHGVGTIDHRKVADRVNLHRRIDVQVVLLGLHIEIRQARNGFVV